MKYIKYYCTTYYPELASVLEERGIPFELTPKCPPHKLISFYCPYNLKLDENCMKWITYRKPLIFVEYTEEECNAAKLLMVLPKYNRVELYRPAESIEYPCSDNRCGIYLHQTKPFVLRKEPKWGKSAFLARNTGYGQLFVDNRVKELVENQNIDGAVILPLLKRDGTESDNTFQLTSRNIIERKSIVIRKEDIVRRCPVCRQEKIIMNASYHMYLDYSNFDASKDFYSTDAVFGEGEAMPNYLISQRFYQLLKANGLFRDMTVMPVFDKKDIEEIEKSAVCV